MSTAIHDDRCASRKGLGCNCAMAVFEAPGSIATAMIVNGHASAEQWTPRLKELLELGVVSLHELLERRQSGELGIITETEEGLTAGWLPLGQVQLLSMVSGYHLRSLSPSVPPDQIQVVVCSITADVAVGRIPLDSVRRGAPRAAGCA